ncbi:MAG: pseudouridine synthase [Opitutaceae bacterium]|nr:pseudouridine synthase [Opitutaceae bacterium]
MPRLDQLLASLGYGSRREVRHLVDAGRVTVDAKVANDAGCKVRELHAVLVDGLPLDHPEPLLLMLHKPAGLVCSHDPREGPSVYDLLPSRWRARNPQVTSVGRLDKDTTGLLLLTDESSLVHRLTSPKHKVPKVYEVEVDTDLPTCLAQEFASGAMRLPGEDKPCEPAELVQTGPRRATVTLTEGRYHQVKRMFAVHGCGVTKLHRSRFGALNLDGVAPGTWRELALDAV